jgi:hypothetical protein
MLYYAVMGVTHTTEGRAMNTLSYTDLTDDQRAAWDAIVDECSECQDLEGDEPCEDHDLGSLTADSLDRLIRRWRRGNVELASKRAAER